MIGFVCCRACFSVYPFTFFSVFRLQCITNVIHPVPWIFFDDLDSFLNFILREGRGVGWCEREKSCKALHLRSTHIFKCWLKMIQCKNKSKTNSATAYIIWRWQKKKSITAYYTEMRHPQPNTRWPFCYGSLHFPIDTETLCVCVSNAECTSQIKWGKKPKNFYTTFRNCK